jgi:hypothetical protein
MKRTTVQLIDDLDGTVIDGDNGGTVAFAFAGEAYEIDLTAANRAALEAALAPYLAVARPVGRRRNAGAASAVRPRDESGPGYTVVREWAQANGIEVSERGKVAAAVIDAYRKAHS